MTVWLVSVRSESGDVYPPFIFHRKPTSEQLEDLVRNPEVIASSDGEFDDGPGDFGSYIYLGVPQEIVIR